MKNIYLFVSFLLFSSVLGCAKNEPETQNFVSCNLNGDLEHVVGQVGMLHYTKALGNLTFSDFRYILKSDQQVLPMVICNLPENLKELKEGQSIQVIFSGSIEILPQNIDANSKIIELTDLKL